MTSGHFSSASSIGLSGAQQGGLGARGAPLVGQEDIAEQKMVTDVGADAKTTAARYDKNAHIMHSPTPIVSRIYEFVKRTFCMTPRSRPVSSRTFDNGQGNVDCHSVIIGVSKLGAEERAKFKLVVLERQRTKDVLRRARA